MTDEQFRKYVQKNFEGIASEMNRQHAELLAYRSVVVALLGLHRLNPEDGARRLETLRDIALANFKEPVDGKKWTPFDDHAIAVVRETFKQVDEAIAVIQQADKPN